MGQDQGSTRGNLGGTVLDKTEAVVAGATVTITGPIGSLTKLTNDQGDFLFPTLIPGFYSVKVEKPGFKIANVTNVEVLINKTTNIRVIIEPGTVTETVEVVATAITVENTSAAVTADLSDSVYKNLPIGRDISNIFYLSPGVASGGLTGSANPSISGSSGLENLYVADGVTINDPGYGGLGTFSAIYGPVGSGINLSFVKEVQIKTAGFEPQYGHASGGIVQLITKSGGTETHGVIGAYFQSLGMSGTYANNDDFQHVNKIGRELHQGSYEGDFELGGYVPLGKLKNHVFYFGAVNPTFNHELVAPAVPSTGPSGLFKITNGQFDRRTNIFDYGAKLTWKVNDRQMIESSIMGDPSHTNHAPFYSLNIDNISANSVWKFGTRNWVARYNGTFGSNWLVNGAFTWDWNHFTESPASPVYHIADLTQIGGLPGQRGSFTAQGIGTIENNKSSSKGLSFDTSKGATFGGHHTLSVGYTWAFPSYDDITSFSAQKYAIPGTNASGATYGLPVGVAGQMSDGAFELDLPANVDPVSGPSCTLCPLMNVPGLGPTRVVLKQTRGRFDGGVSHSTGKYHAAYINDAWEMGKHVTLDVGLRWEQQRLAGKIAQTSFVDMWSPRVGFIVDPKGDRKSKIYANFGRYAFILPLDMAIRELGNEKDFTNTLYAPASDSSGNVTFDSLGSVNVVPDSAHLLNGATGGIALPAQVSIVAGEPFGAGTRMEYTDEFVVGAEHEFRSGIVVSARYIDRRLKRIIEDMGGISVEQFNALAANGGGLNYFIGNPSATSDFYVNPNEITFQGGTIPAACIDKNGNKTPYVALDQADTFGNVVGSVCFPAVNMNPWTDSSGNLVTGALFGGEVQPDGKPDSYKSAKRKYQAVEIEVNKSFSHNWAILANWRIARLQGNYEGAFRNDNGQSDPGISSLYDLTPGKLGLLGQQQGNGVLNTDRKHVVNVYTTYVLDRSIMKGLVLGSGFKLQTGVPLTTLAAQEAYGNFGEVPLFGRGDLGRAPVTGTVDAHVEYPWKLTEHKTLKFGMDLFNIANTKRPYSVNQFVDLGFGNLNKDFQSPGNGQTHGYPNYLSTGFVPPFSAKGSVKFEF
jgi:hypothetical protein